MKNGTDRRKEASKTRFRGGGTVTEGYGRGDRGVRPSNESAWIAQKGELNRPNDPKRGTVGAG